MKKALCLIFATVLALALFGCRTTERVRTNVPYTTTRTAPRTMRTDTRRNITASTPRARTVNPGDVNTRNARTRTAPVLPNNTPSIYRSAPNTADNAVVNPAVPKTVVRAPVNTVA